MGTRDAGEFILSIIVQSVDLKFRSLRAVRICSAWRNESRALDEFCSASDEAWFWHTFEWHNYTLNYRPETNPRLLSFLCLSRQALGHLPADSGDRGRWNWNSRSIFIWRRSCPAPALANGLGEKQRSQRYDSSFQQVDRLAKEHSVRRVSFRTSPPASALWSSSLPC